MFRGFSFRSLMLCTMTHPDHQADTMSWHELCVLPDGFVSIAQNGMSVVVADGVPVKVACSETRDSPLLKVPRDTYFCKYKDPLFRRTSQPLCTIFIWRPSSAASSRRRILSAPSDTPMMTVPLASTLSTCGRIFPSGARCRACVDVCNGCSKG